MIMFKMEISSNMHLDIVLETLGWTGSCPPWTRSFHPGLDLVHPGPELVQPQIIFLRFLVNNFCPKFYFSKLLKVLKKYFTNFNSFMHFQVGPEVVQGGPELVQPGI